MLKKMKKTKIKISDIEDSQIKELMEEEIVLQKKANEEKQEKVKEIEKEEEIFGELEG